MIRGMAALVAAVQRNADIADARHAREVTMCTYLLGMREFFRWEHDLPPGVPPPREAVGRWIAERERRWAEIEDEDYAPLPLAGGEVGAFDAAAANARLEPHGLVYGAGIGRFGKPHFFLARLERAEPRGGPRLQVCGCEYARDIAALPAALQGDTIIVRREALRQWLWQKAEGWGVKRQAGALREALAAYGFDADPAAAIERMATAETETLAWHEEGEWWAARLLGPAWAERMTSLSSRRAELLLRAARDNLADCLVTLPRLAAEGTPAMRQFWLASLDGLRRELFPAMATVGAGDTATWSERAAQGAEHFAGLLPRLLTLPEAVIGRLSARSEKLALLDHSRLQALDSRSGQPPNDPTPRQKIRPPAVPGD